jgi:RNA polymerase sigma factor (sigma-70 family)
MKDNYTELAVKFKETGSHATFTKLYHKMTPGLKHFIKGFVKDADVTEDVLARTFEKIYRKIDTFNPEFSITTWAYSIARRECLRWIKRERNRRVSLSYFSENGGDVVEDGEGNNSISIMPGISFEAEEFITETDTWDEENESIVKYDITVKAINSLKPMYREILVDNLFNGLKYKEIAFKMEPELGKLNLKFEEGVLNTQEEKEYNTYYKTVLQRVKNRVRRGKMIVEDKVKAQLSGMDI